jgi:hypothetical protein
MFFTARSRRRRIGRLRLKFKTNFEPAFTSGQEMRTPAETTACVLSERLPSKAESSPVKPPRDRPMNLYPPNAALFVVATCLAMLGVLAALPIDLPIPGVKDNAAWYIFLGWFLLSAGAVLQPKAEQKAAVHAQ